MSEIMLIDANALKKNIEQWFVKDKYYTNRVRNTIPKIEVFDVIDNTPTVEHKPFAKIVIDEEKMKEYVEQAKAEILSEYKIERPKGEWISDGYGHFYKCSICGREIETEAFENPEWNYPFCHCGAEMRKEKTDGKS